MNFEVFLSSLDTTLIMVNNRTTVAVVPPDSVLAIQNQLSFQIKASAEPHLSRLVLNYLLDNGEGGSDTLFAMIGESGVLLVDDDDGGYHNVEKYYTNILDHQQVDYLRWDHHNLGSPPREMITHFPLIIWFCEWAFPSLTPEDRSALEYYLDNGGSLFISGQDIGWDLADPTGIENSQYSESSLHFYENYLRSIYMSDLSLSSRVFGQPGTIGQELVFEIYQPGIPVNFQFPDWIEPGEGASGCFRYENDKGAGVEFKGDSKVLNLGFGFEAMDGSRYDDPARISKVRLEFMRRLLNEYGPISREPIKDREFAPEPVIFQANISPLVKNINQISLFFKTDSMEDYQESLMIDYGNNAYQVEVDFNQYRGDVYYYFSLITPYYQFNSPAGSSENPFVFSIGQDLVPPVILHNSLRDIINQTTNRKAAIYVEDNMKVDTTSVILFYFTGTIKDSVKMVLRNENWYEAFIPPVCAFGDSLVYYFSARDIANPPNHVISEQYTYKVGKEDFEHGTGFWIADSNSWKLDDLECYSPDYSISTFPGQAYQNGQNVSLYLRNGLKRNKLQNCFLGFRTKYWIENNKDFGYIEVSSNGGIDWQTIHPLVTGEQENWILMNCELDSFYSETDDTLLLRFRLQTDSSQSKPMAGWFIDNIEIQQGSPVGITFNGQNFSKIETFKVLPNVPNPFNATTRITYFVETPGIIAIAHFKSGNRYQAIRGVHFPMGRKG
ncbi:hypothetical protein B6I21_09400 [candidate division KSB1 bacterium 4572_119]|nr:MAG: hypothetical protein B6I21_09400 [candidate division KSB1 bacterium 4572_119]